MELNLSDRHIMALNVLLFAVLAYFAVLSVKDVLAWRAPAEAPIPTAKTKVFDDSFANRSREAYQAIVDRDIFNLVPPPAAAPRVVVEDLHLTLIGVSLTTKGKPYAIIADRSGEQSVYRVGEVIPDSGKLVEVGKDRAIIEHDGKQVAIEIPKEDTSAPSTSAEPMPRRGMRERLSSADESRRDELRHRLMRQRRHE